MEMRYRNGTIRWLKEGFRGDRQPITSIFATDVQGFPKYFRASGKLEPQIEGLF